MRTLRHKHTGLWRGLKLDKGAPTGTGRLLVELEFLSKYCIPNTCVFITCDGLRRLEVLQQLFVDTYFCVVNLNGVNDETYNPEHPGLTYKASVNLSDINVGLYHQRYKRVLFMCSGYDTPNQLKLFEKIKAYKNLLEFDTQQSNKYPQGDLILPVHCGKDLYNTVYLDCGSFGEYTTYDNKLLQEELSAFYVLTRGYLNASYDIIATHEIFNSYSRKWSVVEVSKLQQLVFSCI
jgi:hypothetical protein